MVLQSSGAISLNDIQTEFGGTNPIGINEYYGVASGIPGSGLISFNQFYGTSSYVPPIALLMSKENLGNQGYTNYTLTVSKDMATASGRLIPAHANPSSSAFTPSGTRYSWGDWGDDFFDGWGDFYIYNPANQTAQYIEFSGGYTNNGDSVVWTDTQTAHGKSFRIRHGWATQGIFKLDVECTDSSFEFCLGCYGNMGADGQMVNEDRQHFVTTSGGNLNYTYNWQNTGTAPYREHFFTWFIPKLKSFNASIDAGFSSSNFGSHLTTDPPIYNNTHGDNLAIYTSPLTRGGIFYFVKGANSTTGAMYDWVANDITVCEALYTFTTHTFTNCGATGRTGPTITQVRNEYAPVGGSVGGTGDGQYDDLPLWHSGSWNWLTMTTQGIQMWTVPATDDYEIEVGGASGGHAPTDTTHPGGNGGWCKGTTTLIAGQKLALIVGQKGSNVINTSGAAGGGGASWVLREDYASSGATSNGHTHYAIAGGGGGANGYNTNVAHGQDGQGYQGTSYWPAGGAGGASPGSYQAGGGAGLSSDGAGTTAGSTQTGGHKPANGAMGGSYLSGGGATGYTQRYPVDGGFGGGGASSWHQAGGGGGYKGGDSADWNPPDGMGGSTRTDLMKNETYGTHNGDHGYIKITRLFVSTYYAFSSHTFTNCGATGRTGPTITQVRNTYPDEITGLSYTNYNYNTFVYINTQGVQIWKVPRTGRYEVEIAGAKGGDVPASSAYLPNGGKGGKGAMHKGRIDLVQGANLLIVVGQSGVDTYGANASYGGAGGGGASWLIDQATSTLYAVAGGGGGSNAPVYSNSSSNPNRGGDAPAANNTGGSGGGGTGNYGNGGGAGWTADGGGGNIGGKRFANGALGGIPGSGSTGYLPNPYPTEGGFGGGGGGSWHAGGGGGGWSGGDGVGYTTVPGGLGGTSHTTLPFGPTVWGHNDGTVNGDHGYIKINLIHPH